MTSDRDALVKIPFSTANLVLRENVSGMHAAIQYPDCLFEGWRTCTVGYRLKKDTYSKVYAHLDVRITRCKIPKLRAACQTCNSGLHVHVTPYLCFPP